MKKYLSFLIVLVLSFTSCKKEDLAETEDNGQDSTSITEVDTVEKSENNYHLIKISTIKGEIYLWLFDQTPIHKERFEWMTINGHFDNQTFNRVINNFVIQGGTDLDTLNLDTVLTPSPYEKLEGLVHQFGALGAARTGDDVNPNREDKGDQWYLVEEMNSATAARLDTGYVIFGQVVSDLEVLRQLARVQTNFSDEPLEPLIMQADTVTVKESFLRDSLNFNLESLMLAP